MIFYKIVEKCSFQDFPGLRENVGCFQVQEIIIPDDIYSIGEFFSGMDKSYIKEFVFCDLQAANLRALRKSYEKLGKVIEKLRVAGVEV